MHLPEMTDYEETCRQVRYESPEHYNFGFDLIDHLAETADKTACVAVDAPGKMVTRLTFGDLARASSRFANVLRELGARRGDLAYVMIARIPAWYEVLIGCAKAGVVAMPATNLLTPRDIEYRVNAAGARFAIVTEDNADKVDAVRAACPSLKRLIIVSRGGGPAPRPGWTDFREAMDAASPRFVSDRPTRADEPLLVYFTSGTTAMPKMVPRDHGYALAHRADRPILDGPPARRTSTGRSRTPGGPRRRGEFSSPPGRWGPPSSCTTRRGSTRTCTSGSSAASG